MLLSIVTICFMLTCSQTAPDHIAVIKDYAEKFQPKITKEKDDEGSEYEAPPFAFTEQPEQCVLEAVNALAASQSHEHEKYIVLIFLRHYRAQVELARQSYELREVSDSSGEPKNPLLKEFLRLLNINPKGREFISSETAYAWVVNHPELLKYPPIRTEMERIDKAYENTDEELEKTKGERQR